MKSRLVPSLAILVLLAGCESRSISDSGYHGGGNAYYGRGGYEGELAEADVVGAPVKPGGTVSEADIQRALHGSRPVHAAPGTALVVVQSGAQTPDDAMLQALNRRYQVQPFSGLPSAQSERTEYSKRLRLAAAQGGVQHILVYWGTLESARENQVTKAVSWVPIAGNFVPDENQQMRINLHAVLIDVASGHWSPYTGKPAEEHRAQRPGVARVERSEAGRQAQGRGVREQRIVSNCQRSGKRWG